MVKNSFRVSIFAVFVACLCSVTTTSSSQAIKNGNGYIKSDTSVMWQDPGEVEKLDFVGGVGGRAQAPKPPFTFIEENLSGSNPKVKVTDANGAEWSVKFGNEVNAEVFATRMVWAVGYFVEPSYFVAKGKIERVGKLKRAKKYIKRDGSFTNARFERQLDKDVKSLDGKQSWSWVQNPFIGTKELSGLKVMIMLVSNWDNKDVRDVKRGSNTAIFRYPVNGGTEDRYLVTDWGASMGKWGGFFTREKWDHKGFRKQTPTFTKGVKNCSLIWGYSGQHTKDFIEGIRTSHVRWLMQYLGRITDNQLRAGLQSSGATLMEAETFSLGIRQRISQLDRLLNGSAKGVIASTRPRRCISAMIR